MSDTTTWAVLSDGRYFKVLINKGPGKALVTLKFDDLEAYADLGYRVVNGKLPNAKVPAVPLEQRNYIQWHADFLIEQHEQNLYDLLVIAAPQEVLKSLKDALPEKITQLISGELAEDLLPSSNDVIEKRLDDLIIAGR